MDATLSKQQIAAAKQALDAANVPMQGRMISPAQPTLYFRDDYDNDTVFRDPRQVTTIHVIKGRPDKQRNLRGMSATKAVCDYAFQRKGPIIAGLTIGVVPNE